MNPSSENNEIPSSLLPDITTQKREKVYTIQDAYVGDITIYESLSNRQPWWILDKNKLLKLIDGVKNGLALRRALIYAGITENQYNYFVKLYPEFHDIKDRCEDVYKMYIEKGLTDAIKKGNTKVMMWAAERLIPERFGKNGSQEEKSQTTVNQNFGTVINNTIDPSKIKPSVLKNVIAKKQSGDGV